MLKFNRVVCALVVLALVTVVYAKAVKVTALTPTATENATADGMVIVNYNAGLGVTEVQVALTDFNAGTTYAVLVEGSGAGAGLFITTNPSGNGSGHSRAATDITDGGAACIEVTVWIDDGDNVLTSADDVRATGSSCP